VEELVTAGVRPEFETGADVPEECRVPLRNLLVACADTKLLLGYHYGEWTFGTPTLEAAVAHCSLAQSELGHVRLLHGILKAQYGEDLDALIEGRPGAAFASVGYLDEPLPDWPAVVAMNFVVDLAMTRLIDAMRDSAFTPVRACADKLLEEERYHIHHGRGWFRALATGGEEARASITDRVQDAVATVRIWLGPDGAEGDRALVACGIKAMSDRDLAERLLDDINRVAEPLGVTVASPPAPTATGWNATRRRSAANGPSEEVLYHLRGTKNAIYKLT